MYSEEVKKNNELVWASVFIHEINRLNGFDYTAVPERDENSPVDIYGVSKNKKYPELQLQLTHAVEIPFMAYEPPNSPNYTKQPTLDAIDKKCEKLKRQGADLSKLILIIQGYMNQQTAKVVFSDPDFLPIQKYDFQGIYYVAPPMMSGDTDESLQSGYIVPIKNAF